ncbi:type IV toxin-antitoxin system AbiEi family antitoxin domain-containing protein [Arthrobacter sp. RAF14]|uniref:type IV toxin-antitoxin system AbiEi family antitoxin domain-containing protein n=1 Tax=Arthrobacter sp. RAF14 TaxID=3233051 RepID=UPI003F8EEB4C
MSSPLPYLIRASDVAVHGIGVVELARRARQGRLHRIRRGFYVARDEWERASSDVRHELFLRIACETTSYAFPLYGLSGAFMLGLPLRERPTAAHLAGVATNGGRSQPGMIRHEPDGRNRQVLGIKGLPCSGPVHAALDVAIGESFEWAVAVMDRVLNTKRLDGELVMGDWNALDRCQVGPFAPARRPQGWMLPEELTSTDPQPAFVPPARDRAQMERAVSQIRSGARRTRLETILDFADGNAMLPGESLSRVMMHRLGFPRPVLQQEFRDRAGLIGYTDFWWKPWRVVGEFDGTAKYLKPEYLTGRTPSEVVIAEKRREDRLRRLGLMVVRWTWADVTAPGRLADLLREAGLPVTQVRQWSLPET